MDDINRKERVHKKTKETIKKEVEFTSTPPRSKAGSPVYYPPGSELSRREGSGSMSQSGVSNRIFQYNKYINFFHDSIIL